MDNKEQAKRYNEGKVRLGLIPPFAIEEIGKVFTMGAEKYGAHNWMKGLPYTEVLDSIERHINEFKKGHDKDKESELQHMAHVAVNAIFLIEYAAIYTNQNKFDDRPHKLTPNIFTECGTSL